MELGFRCVKFNS
jgi:hypothetical protein